MTPDKVKQAAVLLADRDALIEARTFVQKKVWRERGEDAPVATVSWDGTLLAGVKFSMTEIDEILRQKLEAVNESLTLLGVALHDRR